MTTKKLLVETLNQLSPEDFDKFKSLLGEEEDVPDVWRRRLKAANTQDVVELMVETYSRECVEATTKVLMKMSRTDLVQRLSGIDSGTKEELWPPLVQRVERMASVIELLLETLEDLSDEELKKLMKWLWMEPADHQDTVILFVQTYGQESVMKIKEALKRMERMDLVQRLSDSSSGLKKKQLDEHLSALIHKVATMSAVKELLLETLKGLSTRDLSKFRLLLQTFPKSFPQNPWSQIQSEDRTHIVDLIMMTFGGQSVEVTRKVFMDMNRTDLVQKLPEIISGQKEKQSVDEQAAASREAAVASVRQILRETLKHFSAKEFNTFRLLLQFTYFQKNLPVIPQHQLFMANTTYNLTDLMEDMWGEQSVEVTREVLKDMNRIDLVQKLSEISSESKVSTVKDQASLFQIEVSLASITEKLKETLTDLNDAELNTFKWILQKTARKRGLPRILSSRMERADRDDVVELMVQMYSEQSVDMTREVFRAMNRPDLVQKLPETSSASKGASSSLELEGHESVVKQQDSSVWNKVEPEVINADADEAPTYSLQSAAGRFECSVSGLRWVCKENASFKYQFCSWGGHMERMESRRYMPAGPLMDLSVIAGKLNEVYLPHWICIDDNPKILDKFAVLHIDDCGDVVEKASEVTASHVKLTEPIFSPRAVLMKMGFRVKIECDVLMYYKPNMQFLKLHVFVIPHDPALQQRVDQEESSSGYEKIIKKPRPDKYLQMQQGFTLTADIDTATIQPKKITLRYDNQDPNFYEVFIENPDRRFNMTLHAYSKKDEVVWTCEIRKDDHPNSGPAQAAESTTGSCSCAAVKAAGSLSGATGGSAVADDKPSVDEQLSAQLHKAATITSDRERILEVLGHLKKSELKEFKWTLEDRNLLLDLPCIPRCNLEEADMFDLVDLMIAAYSQQSVEVTKKVFKKINRNDLVLKLSDSSS